MRLGVKLDTHNDDPEEIARAYVDAGYSAAVCWADRLANPWLENGAVLGLGTNDPDNMDLVEVSLR